MEETMTSRISVQDPCFAAGIAVVAGGSGGIGAAICLALAGAGSDIALTYRNKEQAARDVADQVQSLGRTAEIVQLRLEDAEAVKSYIDDLAGRHGRLHSVIYAAGPPLPIKFISQLTPREWKDVFDADVNGCFNLVWACLPHLKRQGGGTITALITAAVDMAPPRDILSAAPKAAIEMLIRGVAKEEGRYGVRANCVGPGMINAGLGRELIGHAEDTAGLAEKLRNAASLKRFGEAHEVAEAVLFLASSRAAFITGHSIHVDGGARL
jgi:NAD(P)-dependent dehydrogenase (short-subunit alcohol dehydrogenase family)